MATARIMTGTKALTTPATAVQFTTTETLCRVLVLTSPNSNVGVIYVGDSNVTAADGVERGMELQPGAQITLDMGSDETGLKGVGGQKLIDVSDLWLDALNASDAVAWFGLY